MVFVTIHGALRALQRIGVGDKEAQRLASEAYYSGEEFHETKGKLRKYLERLKERRLGARARVYKGYIFIFDRDRLVTVYPIPDFAEEFEKKKPSRKKLRHFDYDE